MSNIIHSHFEKLMREDISAADDYSVNLIGIVRIGSNPQTVNCAGATGLLTELLKQHYLCNGSVLINRSAENYGVLTLQSPCASFLNYACIAENGRIVGITLYIYQPSVPVLPASVSLNESKEASKIFWKHFRSMFSVKASVITKDYAEDGVVITNMTKDVCDGKPAIYAFCDNLMKNTWRLIKKMDFHGIASVRWKILSAEPGLLLFTIEAPKMNMIMTETYWIKNRKIQFECSIAHGAMLDLVHELLN